jgi:L-arabinokinase
VGLFGIDSAVKHKVGGGQYGRVRTAARMGEKILSALAPSLPATGYLADIALKDYQAVRHQVPLKLAARDFLGKYGPLKDPHGAWNLEESYRVSDALDHHIAEAQRVPRFAEFFQQAAQSGQETETSARALEQAGELMLQSHASYSQHCGLGCQETDFIVGQLMERGRGRGIYGARISGGGSGGTVAILADKAAQPLVEEAAAEYGRCFDAQPRVFAGSLPGSWQQGVRLQVRGGGHS